MRSFNLATRKLVLALAVALVVPSVGHASGVTTTPSNVPNTLRPYAATEASRDLLVRVDEVLNALTYTTYVFGGNYLDFLRGIYKVDCTGYLNHLVEDVAPSAYDALLDLRGTSRPSARDYVAFFRGLPYDTARYGWQRIRRARDLRPGDVLVWRYDDPSSVSTGHAVVVVSLPTRDLRWSNVFRLRVSDSARSGHSYDNRGSTGQGVGAGEMLVKVDGTSGVPTQIAWSLRGIFRSDIAIAAARVAD